MRSIVHPMATACLACALLISGSVVFPTSAMADVLSADDKFVAQQLANETQWRSDTNRFSTSNTLQTRIATLSQEPHTLGIQTLSVEFDERKHSDGVRRARVYQFNYDAQQARLIIVDLPTQRVTDNKPIASVHLPLNDTEIDTSRQMVESNADIMRAVNEEQARRGLTELTNLSSIDVKASIFEPVNDEHECASMRCALISLFDATRTVFSVEPVVNLQSLTVSTLKN